MSVKFNLSDLSPEVKKSIREELTIIPLDPYVENLKKWGRAVTSTNFTPPVLMFLVNAEEKTVKLPFNSAMTRMGTFPNRDKEYPKICESGIPEFHAKLKDYQIQPAREALQQLKKNSTTTLGLPPGWGKTILGAWLAGKANGPVIVFSHRMPICEAWVNTFKLCYPQYSDSIWLVGENEIKEGVRVGENIIPRFIICMDGRIGQLPEHIKTAVCVTIIDEAHLFCTPSRVECLLCTEPKYVIAETATLVRGDGMHKMIECIVGKEGVFRKPNKPYRVYLLDTGVQIELKQGTRGLDFGNLTKDLITHEERNNQILNIIQSNMHRKIMIMTRQKNHVQLLKRLLEENNISVATLYGSQKNYSDSHVLIGTIPKMGTGFDEKNSCHDFKGFESNLMLLVTSIKDQQLFDQIKGRIMRASDPVLMYFRDNITVVKSHIRNITPWIEETNGTVYKIKYKQDEIFVPDMDYTSGGAVLVPPKKKKLVILNKKAE